MPQNNSMLDMKRLTHFQYLTGRNGPHPRQNPTLVLEHQHYSERTDPQCKNRSLLTQQNDPNPENRFRGRNYLQAQCSKSNNPIQVFLMSEVLRTILIPLPKPKKNCLFVLPLKNVSLMQYAFYTCKFSEYHIIRQGLLLCYRQ